MFTGVRNLLKKNSSITHLTLATCKLIDDTIIAVIAERVGSSLVSSAGFCPNLFLQTRINLLIDFVVHSLTYILIILHLWSGISVGLSIHLQLGIIHKELTKHLVFKRLHTTVVVALVVSPKVWAIPPRHLTQPWLRTSKFEQHNLDDFAPQSAIIGICVWISCHELAVF